MKDNKRKREYDKQMRIENLELQRENMLKQGYREYIGTMSVIKLNIMAFITAGPFALLAYFVYFKVWGEFNFKFDLLLSFMFTILLLISIPVHEFLHGFTWHFFCKDKWKSICFFVMWEYLTPCCHCKESLKYGKYLLGGLMPFFVLGVGISAVGIVFHSSIMLLIGIFSILSAGGDTTIACMSFKYHDCLMIDHPTECGFIAFKK